MTKRKLHAGAEEGTALIMALVFLSLFGLVISALLGFAETGFKATGVVRDRADRVYAADGAVEGAINNIRDDLDLGRDDPLSDCPTFTAPLNGSNVVVECDAKPGSGASTGGADNSLNKPKYAILTLGDVAGEGITQTSNAHLRIRGGVFSNRDIDLGGSSAVLEVDGAVSAVNNCDHSKIVSPQIKCANTVPPDPPPFETDPNYPAATSVRPAVRAVPSCGSSWIVRFTPGTYTDVSALNGLTDGSCSKVLWFEPGNYYFEFDGTEAQNLWHVKDANLNLIAGTPLGWDAFAASKPAIPFPNGCDNSATGAQFMFGGVSSRLFVESGAVEVCAQPHATQQRIAFYGVKTTGGTTGPQDILSNAVAAAGTFTNAANAIGAANGSEATTSATSDATITLSWPSASSIPPTALIELAELRITHRDQNRVRRLDVTVDPATAPACATATGVGTISSSLHADLVDVTSCLDTPAKINGGLTVKYDAIRQGGGSNTLIEHLDAIELVVHYRTGLTGLSGCVIDPNPAARCPVLHADGAQARVAMLGTVYTPRNTVRINLTNISYQVFRRGLIAKSFSIGITPSATFTEPFTDLPPDGSGANANRKVLFTALIDGVPRLRALVTFQDCPSPPAACVVNTPGMAVLIDSWSVL